MTAGAASGTDVPQLSPLEVATSEILGDSLLAADLPDPGGTPARAALEALALRALLRPPCVVAFSGGRDSSAVLAVTTHVARKEGLPLPVPVTYRWPGLPATDEEHWQRLVVEHLEVQEWSRLDLDDDLDLVGPLATSVLSRYGPMWPPTSHLEIPLVRQAKGGTLLTGEGGDELFGPHRAVALSTLLGHRRRPPARSVRRTALAVIPRKARTRVLAIRLRPTFPWLRADASRALGEARAAVAAREPIRRDRFLAWHLRRRREREVWEWWGRTLAAEYDVEYREPLLDPFFVSSLAVEGGWRGYRSRTAAMQHLFGDLLPAPLIARTTKVRYGGVYFHRYSRAFSREWAGAGLDDELVDVDGLRATWAGPAPPPASWTLLQAAWLSGSRPTLPSQGQRAGGSPPQVRCTDGERQAGV